MANIFSGLFNQNATGQNLQYKQDLEDYETAVEEHKQRQAVQGMKALMDAAQSDMTPERKRILDMQRGQMAYPAMFDKGMEGYSTSIKQRGTTISDIQKQDKALETANQKHQYKVDNPLGSDVGAKLQYAYEYAGGREAFNALPLKDKQLLMDRAARARQLVNRGTYWEDVVTGKKYTTNLGDVEIEKGAAIHITDRLTGYADNLAKRDNQMVGMDEYITQLELLNEGADWTTTGLMQAALGWIPGMDQRDWKNTLDTVNAKSVMEAMTTLKAMSSTGSTGFGAVNLKELETMQDNWGKLDALSSPEQIKSVIQDRLRILKKLQANVRGSMADDAQWYKNNRAKLPLKYRDAFNDPAPIQTPAPATVAPEQSIPPKAVGRWNPETQKIEMY